ncbi:MAG: hypothetical protein KatS3mg114_0520 [Planctomycetaceae bacterium]|nr:MAG: hypothetical protein KatS3mg114_0520 [Planctomycetaceae bacterium]
MGRTVTWLAGMAHLLVTVGWLGMWLYASLWAGEPAPSTPTTSQTDKSWWQQLDESDLRRHVSVLAADALEGREAGQRGGQAAAAYLVQQFRQLGLAPAGDGMDYRQAFQGRYQNVLGLIRGQDADLQREWIVLGAHYDHVGYGRPENSFGPWGQIHNGADDNASGVALLLEVAQAWQQRPQSPRRTLMFAAWDAEELGLLGSRHWIQQHAASSRQRIVLALNFDMVGRLRHDRVNVMGWRTAVGLRTLVSAANQERLRFQFASEITADSDHYPFYELRYPFIHVDTFRHEDYHRPSDDADKLNYTGMLRLGRVVLHLLDQLDQQPQLPTFRQELLREANWIAPDPTRRIPAPIRLGVSWDLEQTDRARIVYVAPRSPADQVGLRPGDVLLRFGSWQAGSLASLQNTIVSAPRRVFVEWQRPGEPEPRQATIILWGDAVRSGLHGVQDPAVSEGILVTQIVRSSPAEAAGILPGDYLLRWRDQPVRSIEQLTNLIKQDVGPIPLTLEREGIRYVAKLTLPSAENTDEMHPQPEPKP